MNETALTKQPKNDVKALLQSDKFKDQIAKALPRHITPDRFARVAITAVMRQPKLAECDQASLFNALMTCGQLGIEPDGRMAHLIPFNNKSRGCMEVQLIIDYKGLADLAMRSGVISNIHADVVCDNDSFVYDRGQVKEHVIDFKKGRGQAYAAYCIVKFKDGSEKAEAMGKEDIEAIRKRSRSANCGPWETDWAEMAKKTVFRRVAKWLPLSAEFRQAVSAEDEMEEIQKPKHEVKFVTVEPPALPVETVVDVQTEAQEVK